MIHNAHISDYFGSQKNVFCLPAVLNFSTVGMFFIIVLNLHVLFVTYLQCCEQGFAFGCMCGMRCETECVMCMFCVSRCCYVCSLS